MFLFQVLRETKALLSDVIEGDLDAVFQATKESLKLPIKPSNTNLLIDVLKDVLYVLETNTNTALLALLVQCFSYSTSLVEVLRNHLKLKQNNMCPCKINYDDVAESCIFVKDFDLYNERLLQIGSFAISCSSDQKSKLKSTVIYCIGNGPFNKVFLKCSKTTEMVNGHCKLVTKR